MGYVVNSSLVRLASNRDLSSVLVPAYAFLAVDDARVYARDPSFLRDNGMQDPSDAFAPIVSTGGRIYVPRMSATRGKWMTKFFLTAPVGKPFWEVLREKEKVKPVGSYHVALVVVGARHFSRAPEEAAKYQLAAGNKDCFVVWGNEKGDSVKKPIVDEVGIHVFVARTGREVLYARELRFDAAGVPIGFYVHLTLIEFSVFDADPAKDDMLRVKLFKYTSQGEEPLLKEHDEGWLTLIERARKGFNRFCRAR